MRGFFIIMMCAAITLLAEKFGILQAVREKMERGITSLMVTQSLVRQLEERPWQILRDMQAQRDEYTTLQHQYAKLVAEKEQWKTDMQEWEAYKKTKNIDDRYIPTQLIVSDRVVIPLGTLQGVRPGSLVLAEGNALGIVIQSGMQFSQIEVIEHFTRKLQVRLSGTRTFGVLSLGKQGLRVDHIDINTPIENGQTVVTGGDETGILPNIPIGKVTKIIRTQGETSQSVEIEVFIHAEQGLPVAVLPIGEEDR
ncbi:MAG: rod shape-determining protein MreC [Candidatus Pacebacteria bacterium]|nr:rod shape-determining protein MreC [Candidatus Paceibacterota bacterium]